MNSTTIQGLNVRFGNPYAWDWVHPSAKGLHQSKWLYLSSTGDIQRDESPDSHDTAGEIATLSDIDPFGMH